MASPKRTTLMLCERIDVIRQYEQGGHSMRRLAQDFGVGRTQIQNIIKRKRQHLDDLESNAPATKKRNARPTGNEEINELCWAFYQDTASRGGACTGPMLQEAALRFAKDLGVTSFKASNGWLDSFKRRHNIYAWDKPEDSRPVDYFGSTFAGPEQTVPSITADQVTQNIDAANLHNTETTDHQSTSASGRPTDGATSSRQNVPGVTNGCITPDSSDLYCSDTAIATTEKDQTTWKVEERNPDEQAATLSVEAVREEEEEEDRGDRPTGRIQNFRTAIEAVQQMKLFCLTEGLEEALLKADDLEHSLITTWMERRAAAAKKQSKMENFFKKV